jgi:hypothetical protein
MPDHVHAILSFIYTEKSIHRILVDGKRFITYDFIDYLTEANNVELLERLSDFVNETDRKNGKSHQSFEPSIDRKECYMDDFMEQKLNYIKMNPCVCNPPVAKTPIEYLDSSANYYLAAHDILLPVGHVVNMKGINIDKK